MKPPLTTLILALPLLWGSTTLAANLGDRLPAQPHRFTVRPAGKPATVVLWYADGGNQPEDGPYCTGLKPPAWRCTFGVSADDCMRKVQVYLDRWYAPFNVVFSFTRPHNGDYYTLIITSTNAWCSLNTTEAGVAPFNCNDNPGQTAFAFECGYDAHDCALVIAHEHAHMVGLDHTNSTTDIMYQTTLGTIDGFEDKENRTPDALCAAKQNSYQMMLGQLGPWPGGEKPSPFGVATSIDAGTAPQVDAGDAATSAIGVGGTGPVQPPGDARNSLLAGFDAVARPEPFDDGGPPVLIPRPANKSGCGFQPSPRGSAANFLAFSVAAAMWIRRKRTP